MEIGQKNKRKLVHDKEEFVDPSFFKIQFSIGGKVFKKAVDGLLAFEAEELSQLTDEDLDKALDQCSYYRFTFMAAGEELETAIMKTKRGFDTWLAGAQDEARSLLIDTRLDIRANNSKVPNSWLGSITKEEVKGKILTTPHLAEKYHEYTDKISDMVKQKNLCLSLRDIIQERGRHLQSLGRRRLENQRMSFGVKDYVQR